MADKFELTPVLNEGKYEISNYQEQLKLIKEFTESLPVNLVIKNEDDYQFVKGKRTTANKYEDVIKNARKTINDIVLGTLNTQLKDIEKIIKEKSKQLTNLINQYKNKTPKISYSINIVVDTKEEYERIKHLLDENKINYK